MAGAAAVRLFLRSTSVRNAAARLSSGAKTSSFRFPTAKPISHRIFRCPVELSVCLETEQPFHAVTSSALMTSMLILSRRTCGWLPEAFNQYFSKNVQVHEKNAKKSGQFDKNMGIRDGLFLAEKGL
ncbi:hypothetical protein L2E82_41742 [Cichorium intybus]|uniref:Uncharacterized protein n=1 Tax=Cichorium intybus TaxID=13427 RepID=A0ACB8ZLU1_CICIN|nr:hypothetical protein L2E82_41742 [Cichorium intybus]